MFEQELILYFLILLPVFLGIFIWRGMVRARILRSLGDSEMVAALAAQVSRFRRQLKAVLWLVTLAMLILALARPVWGTEEERIRTEGVQIIVAMDISRSMDAIDMSPSRLDRARFDMLGLLEQLAGNDIGIVLFAQEAFVYMPMTYDFRAVEVFMNDISTGMVTFQGTNIPAAIEIAMGAFELRSEAQPVILLVSDGESHEGDAIAAAQRANEERVIIYTLGYGTETGANIPLYNDLGDVVGFHTDGDTNNLVTTYLNGDLLQRVANATGGFYMRGGSDLAPLLADIQTLQAGEIGEEVVTRPIERFSIFVAFALAALSFEILLPETRREDD